MFLQRCWKRLMRLTTTMKMKMSSQWMRMLKKSPQDDVVAGAVAEVGDGVGMMNAQHPPQRIAPQLEMNNLSISTMRMLKTKKMTIGPCSLTLRKMMPIPT